MRPCPVCKSPTLVYGQDVGQDTVIRYRRCKNPECRHTFKTIATPERYLIDDHEEKSRPVLTSEPMTCS